MKRIISLLLTAMLLLICTASAFAESKVTYDGNAQDFIYAPENLFEEFSDVMPGDKLTQRITIDNDISEQIKIKVYVRCASSNDESGLLSQLKMTVDQVDYTKLFSGNADELTGLSEWKYLGTVYSGGDIKLDLTLEVPLEMGNEFQNVAADLTWEFMVEELPIEPEDPTPETSDMTVAIVGGIVLLAVLAFILLATAKKRRA